MICILFVLRNTKAFQLKVINCENVHFCDLEHINSRELIKNLKQTVEFTLSYWIFASEPGHLSQGFLPCQWKADRGIGL